jgi:hypothetical protein
MVVPLLCIEIFLSANASKRPKKAQSPHLRTNSQSCPFIVLAKGVHAHMDCEHTCLGIASTRASVSDMVFRVHLEVSDVLRCGLNCAHISGRPFRYMY